MPRGPSIHANDVEGEWCSGKKNALQAASGTAEPLPWHDDDGDQIREHGSQANDFDDYMVLEDNAGKEAMSRCLVLEWRCWKKWRV